MMLKYDRITPYLYLQCLIHGIHLAVQDVLYKNKVNKYTDQQTVIESIEPEPSDPSDSDSSNRYKQLC